MNSYHQFKIENMIKRIKTRIQIAKRYNQTSILVGCPGSWSQLPEWYLKLGQQLRKIGLQFKEDYDGFSFHRYVIYW